MSKRTEQVNEVIRHELAPLIQKELGHLGLITIIDVFTSPDLSTAKVWVGKLEKLDPKSLLLQLNRLLPELQKHLNRRLVLKKVPRIEFAIDTREEEIERVEEIIDSLKDET